MIGDVIRIDEKHYETSRQIMPLLDPLLRLGTRMAIAVGGESGCGKSVTAICLRDLLREQGVRAVILHLDDYFVYPPATNHRRREEDIQRVGMQEVHLALLQEHVLAFKAGARSILKPLSNYHTDTIEHETLDTHAAQVLLVEGTYSLALQAVDCKIFMTRNYLETWEQRRQRGREAPDAFIERVLAIEHALIAPFAATADILIDRTYRVTLQNRSFQNRQA